MLRAFFIAWIACIILEPSAGYGQDSLASNGTAVSDTTLSADSVAMDHSAGVAAFKASKCGSCHSVEVAGIARKQNQKSPDLSSVGALRTSEWISRYLKKEEAIDGQKHIKKFAGSDDELEILSKWLGTLK